MSETIICARCGGDSPSDARFCIDCGAALAGASTGPTTRLSGVSCPACRALNPPDARFCTACGRSQGGPQPHPRPVAPPQPRTPQQSYPRMATPPQLSPYRPPMPPAQRRIGAGRPAAPLVFLIGLAVLLATGAIWPGILVLIGVMMLFGQLGHGRADKGLRALLWFGGLAVLFSTGRFWPGILLLVLLNAALGSWGRRGRNPW